MIKLCTSDKILVSIGCALVLAYCYCISFALAYIVIKKNNSWVNYVHLDCANFELTNHIAYRVENKSLISTPRKLISTAGKLIFQVREYT